MRYTTGNLFSTSKQLAGTMTRCRAHAVCLDFVCLRALSFILLWGSLQRGSCSSCPAWIDEYETFHRTMRGATDAKYLVHEVEGLAGGLGDRLRGMLFSVRVAHALKRVVLFNWNHPFQVDNFFEPASSINWTMTGIDYQKGRTERFIDHQSHVINEGLLMQVTDTFITLQTNMFMTGNCSGCPPLHSGFSADAVCLWKRVLQPARVILQRSEAILQQLFPHNQTFAAVHMRMGGLTGEGVQERGNGPLRNFMDAITCARDLAKSTSIQNTTPILVVTDNHDFRQFLHNRNIPSIVAPPALPVHLDHARQRSVEDHQLSIVDLVMLAKSKCLVMMRSGFPHHAWLYGGGKPCIAQLPGCERQLTLLHVHG